MTDWQSTPLAVEDSVAYRVHRLGRLLRKHFAGLARQHDLDLTAEQWFILNRLRREDGRPQNALGDALFSDRPNLTRMFARLEKRGWIVRRSDPTDGRRSLVWLTDVGRAVHDQFAEVAESARERLFAGLDPGAVQVTMSVLEQIEDALLADT